MNSVKFSVFHTLVEDHFNDRRIKLSCSSSLFKSYFKRDMYYHRQGVSRKNISVGVLDKGIPKSF